MLEALIGGVVVHKDGGEMVTCSAVGRIRWELLFRNTSVQKSGSLVFQVEVFKWEELLWRLIPYSGPGEEAVGGGVGRGVVGMFCGVWVYG